MKQKKTTASLFLTSCVFLFVFSGATPWAQICSEAITGVVSDSTGAGGRKSETPTLQHVGSPGWIRAPQRGFREPDARIPDEILILSGVHRHPDA
jgi:hypothetical protein